MSNHSVRFNGERLVEQRASPRGLLDLGFQAVLTRILNHLSKQRRRGLFSATMTDVDALFDLVRVSLRNPTRVIVKVQSKKIKSDIPQDAIASERRIPAKYVLTSLIP